jgi:hypothetical protein
MRHFMRRMKKCMTRSRPTRGGLGRPAWCIQYRQTNSAPGAVALVKIAPVELLPKYRLVPADLKRAVLALVFSLTHRWVAMVELHGEVKTLPVALLFRHRPVVVFLIRKPEPVLI